MQKCTSKFTFFVCLPFSFVRKPEGSLTLFGSLGVKRMGEKQGQEVRTGLEWGNFGQSSRKLFYYLLLPRFDI